MKRLAFAALLLAACGGDDGGSVTPDAATTTPDSGTAAKVVAVTCPATPAATVMAVNGTDAYMPMSTTISVGQIVRFQISSFHDVTPNTIAPLTDPAIQVSPGQTKCLQFNQAGTYGFYCSPHGFTGSITVN